MSRRISSPELIGRDAELSLLHAALAEARDGHGRVVLIEGDAGLGKTRLAEHFISQAGPAVILASSGIPLAADVPYAPLIEVFRALAGRHPRAAAVLMPGDGPGGPGPAGTARLLGAAAEALRAVAASGPAVLVVDDLHWADASTRVLLSYLARALRRDPVLIVLTVRTEELGPGRPAGELVAELARAPHVERIALRPLDRDGVAAQLLSITGVPPSAALVDRMVERAAGNPFFTEELLAAGDAGAAGRSPGQVPPGVREVVLTRAARLPAAGQRVLQAAAVLGRRVPHDLLAAVTGPGELAAGLPPVVAFRLLEPAGDSYLFRHPLIQEAVYGSLLPADRRELHTRAARALAAADQGAAAGTAAEQAALAAETAHHWRAAGAAGPALAAALRAAGLATAASAPAEAHAWYEAAIGGWAAAAGTPEARTAAGAAGELAVQDQAADAASLAGRNRRAQELLRRALDRTDQAARPVEAALRWQRLGRCYWLTGDQEESRQAYEQALAVIPAEPSAARAQVLGAMAQSLMLRSRSAVSSQYAGQAIAVAVQAGAHAQEAHARNTLGCDLCALGRPDEGIAELRVALDMARQAGDAAETGRCLINLTENLVTARRCTDAVRTGQAGIAEATALGLAMVHVPVILGDVLSARYLIGQWDDVIRLATEALEPEPEGIGGVPLRLARARAALGRGDLALAGEDIAALAAFLDGIDNFQYGAKLIALRARLSLVTGHPAEAREAIRAGLERTARLDDLALHLELAAWGVAVEADALDAARRHGRRPGLAAAGAAVTGIIAQASATTERITALGGGLSPAHRLHQAVAAAHAARVPGPADPGLWAEVAGHPLADPLLVATARYQEAAALLAGPGHRARAAAALAEAAWLARDLGAVPLAGQVAELARAARISLPGPGDPGPADPRPGDPRPGELAAGQPARPEPDPGEVDLTRREREVLRLLGHGLSNAQIARTLFISEKTASVHVSNILRKLGVTSRVQAALAASRLASGPARADRRAGPLG
jgi:DNA-binding CsgD family transcriptional regulator/tetratricopeptide (TPR) repeat protein